VSHGAQRPVSESPRLSRESRGVRESIYPSSARFIWGRCAGLEAWRAGLGGVGDHGREPCRPAREVGNRRLRRVVERCRSSIGNLELGARWTAGQTQSLDAAPRGDVTEDGLHGQATSGRSSDEGLCSKMDFVILIVRLTTGECQGLLLLDQAMLVDHGAVDMTAIYTTQAAHPHPPIWALQV
jgi:hypothetical protein